MKTKIRPDDVSTLQMNDWLAELRDDGGAEPPAEGRAEPASGGAWPEAPAQPAAPAEPAVPAEPAAAAGAAMRAVIGDQLRIPIMWCEMGSCISWHADPAALGEGDMRARAIGAGWRIDAFGRLACPRCQQTSPGFRASCPVVLWDRYTAMARAARIAAIHNDRAARKHPAANTMPAGQQMR
jgi:hypothetical protein